MNRCTIITCYYKFPSKHRYESYDQWMSNFLTTVETPMVIYTDDQSIQKITQLCEWRKNNTIIVNKPLLSTFCAQQQYLDYWNKDWQRDPEKRIHNPNLYIIWNEKSNFVKEAIQQNYFKTDYFCWCDIGCFRTSNQVSKYRNFPDILKLTSNDKIHLLNIGAFESDEYQYVEKIKKGTSPMKNIFLLKHRIGGTIFLGHVNAWAKWIPLFYSTMELFMKHNTFTGKDQDIMAMIVLLYPELVHLIKPPDSNGWFYLQDYFTA
jgi:hypothetical protein